jgi:hypothetical protein
MSLKIKLKSFLNKFNQVKINKNHFDQIKNISAKQLIFNHNKSKFNSINQAEFKVFSQWGEDGIIQYLINKIPIKNKTFIEFGVENYEESNTRFLLSNDHWSGLVIDGSEENINYIKSDDIFWKYNLEAICKFVTKKNINTTLKKYVSSHNNNNEIGLLSIDLDGNDYWIWESIIDIEADIVICEYNWIFGSDKNVSVPYDPKFNRTEKHPSNLYFGASIQALVSLADKKGYHFIGTNIAGNDAFFVKKILAEKYIPELIKDSQSGYHPQGAKESRNKNGQLTFISGPERIKQILDMPLIDLNSNQMTNVGNSMENK